MDTLYELSLDIYQFRIHRNKIQTTLEAMDLPPHNFNISDIKSWGQVLQKIEYVFLFEAQFPELEG